MEKILWQDKKRTLFGLPLSFTTYIITEEKLLIQSGFLNKKEEEVRLYRILDLTLRRSLGQRLSALERSIAARRTSPRRSLTCKASKILPRSRTCFPTPSKNKES